MQKIILLLISSIFFSASFTQTKGNINLTKGQKFFVDSKITAVTTQTLMGQSMESNAELLGNYSIEVKDKKDNNYNLSNTFTKMKMKMTAMGSDINFDSDKKEDMDGEYGASFKDIINKPKDIVIDKSGNILNAKKETVATTAQSDMMKMMIDQLLGDPEESGYGVNLAFVSTPSLETV